MKYSYVRICFIKSKRTKVWNIFTWNKYIRKRKPKKTSYNERILSRNNNTSWFQIIKNNDIQKSKILYCLYQLHEFQIPVNSPKAKPQKYPFTSIWKNIDIRPQVFMYKDNLYPWIPTLSSYVVYIRMWKWSIMGNERFLQQV